MKPHTLNLQVSFSQSWAIQWGVRTVPSTYVLNASGNITHINNGLATEKQLLDQLGWCSEYQKVMSQYFIIWSIFHEKK